MSEQEKTMLETLAEKKAALVCGNVLDEEEYIGPKVRQVGWMRSPDDVIYIRNHPKEKEYRVFKERCAIIDWF